MTVPTGDVCATLPTKLPLAGGEGIPQVTGGAAMWGMLLC